MAGVEFLDIRVSDDGRQIATAGTRYAWFMANVLLGKQYRNTGDVVMKMYSIAQEMQMNLVSGYRCRVAGYPGFCRCFQGDTEFLAAMQEDPQYAELIQDALKRLDSIEKQ